MIKSNHDYKFLHYAYFNRQLQIFIFSKNHTGMEQTATRHHQQNNWQF